MNGPKNHREHLESYSGLFSSEAQVHRPADLAELRRIFADARQRQRKVTLRGGGHAFDRQSLGDDDVVLMKRFDKIEVLKDRCQVCVGAGATWGAILAAVKPHGLVPPGIVTTSHATAAGTLASDCLSRFSPRYGKEAAWVERFSLLTVDGRLLECSRPPKDVPQTTWTLEQRVFMAAIGGFGYLGAMVEITHNLLSLEGPRIGVETQIRRFDTFRGLADDLIPATRTSAGLVAPPVGQTRWDAVSAGLYPAGAGSKSAMLFSSRFTPTTRRRPLMLHRPNHPLRIAAEFLMRIGLLCRVLSWCFFRFTRDGATYVDDLEGYMFFMDANATARNIAKRFGRTLLTAQQTFVVPVSVARTGSNGPQEDLVKWLELANDLFKGRDLSPTLQDVLYLPEDLALCLSPNAGVPGFAVSYAFETSNHATLHRAEQAFTDLAETLAALGGRVSLVKNVFASGDTLKAMYGTGAVEFLDLKRQLDPTGIIRNDFFERVLG